jgi:hypothetical protein
MISWMDNNMILGPEDLVMQVKANLMNQFECNDCGHLEEYVGSKIKYVLICANSTATELQQGVQAGKEMFQHASYSGTVLKNQLRMGRFLAVKTRQF